MGKFRVGDRVQIARLERSPHGNIQNGIIGHIGTITYIDNNDIWHVLRPNCVGGSWTEGCLELYFDIWETEQSENISKLFEEKVKQINNGNK